MTTFIFDLDNTLYQVSQPFKKACKLVFKERVDNIDLDKLFDIRNHYSNQVFEASAKGTMSMEDMYCYRIAMALKDFGIEISREEALKFQEVYANCQNDISLSNELKKQLKKLKEKGIKLGIISNGPSKHQWNKIYNLGLLEFIDKENIVISGDIGLIKPEKEIFEYLLERMNITKENTYYIGDNFQSDILGAASAGLKTIWINYRFQKITDNIFDYQVTNENELLTLLDNL